MKSQDEHGQGIPVRAYQKGAISSVGRALQSHCRGHWFKPSIAHQSLDNLFFSYIAFFLFLASKVGDLRNLLRITELIF